jgi:hypothetical protein
MIKKLRNQPYAPIAGESSQMGAKRKKKNYNSASCINYEISHYVTLSTFFFLPLL